MRREYVFDPEDPNLELSVAEKVQMRAAAAAQRKAKLFPIPAKKELLPAPSMQPTQARSQTAPGAVAKPPKPPLQYGPPIWLYRPVKVADIAQATAWIARVSLQDLIGERRTKNFVIPRQIAMAASKLWTPRSMPEIGRQFGNRDHTTVLHAIRQVAVKRIVGDQDYLRICAELARHLDRTWPEPTRGEAAAALEWKSKHKARCRDGYARIRQAVGGHSQALVP